MILVLHQSNLVWVITLAHNSSFVLLCWASSIVAVATVYQSVLQPIAGHTPDGYWQVVPNISKQLISNCSCT